MSGNLKIVSDNIGNVSVTTLVAGSESGALVVDNLKLDSKTLVWRSNGTTTDSVTATHTSTAIGCVSLPICNFTSTATMRVRVYTSSGDPIAALDTGNLLCCEYTTIDKIDFNGSLNSNTFSYGGGTYATLFFTETVGEKTVIDIIDTANTNGYLEASSIVIGTVWQPVINATYGASWMLNDTTKHKRNESGDLMTNRGARYRSLAFSLSQMDASDRTEFMQIMIRNGMSKNLFISIFPDSADTQEEQMYQIYGRQSKLTALTRFTYSLDKSAISILEI